MIANNMRAILSLSIVALVVGIVVTVIGVELGQLARDLLMLVTGHVMAKFSGVYDYWFGSSDGSKTKDALMAARPEGTPDDPVHIDEAYDG